MSQDDQERAGQGRAARDAAGPGPDPEPEPARRLILLRHAKSDWPAGPDHERPLAKRGRRDAPVVGRWLGESGYWPDAVVCSTARRARETWELAGPALAAAARTARESPRAPAGEWSLPSPRFEPRVYEASVLGLLMLVREFAPRWRTVLVVGHNPGLAELTVGLAGEAAAEPLAFPTAFTAVLGLPGDWAGTAPGEARLLDFAVPAGLRGAPGES